MSILKNANEIFNMSGNVVVEYFQSIVSISKTVPGTRYQYTRYQARQVPGTGTVPVEE